jgi:hypothetical protein
VLVQSHNLAFKTPSKCCYSSHPCQKNKAGMAREARRAYVGLLVEALHAHFVFDFLGSGVKRGFEVGFIGKRQT